MSTSNRNVQKLHPRRSIHESPNPTDGPNRLKRSKNRKKTDSNMADDPDPEENSGSEFNGSDNGSLNSFKQEENRSKSDSESLEEQEHELAETIRLRKNLPESISISKVKNLPDRPQRKQNREYVPESTKKPQRKQNTEYSPESVDDIAHYSRQFIPESALNISSSSEYQDISDITIWHKKIKIFFVKCNTIKILLPLIVVVGIIIAIGVIAIGAITMSPHVSSKETRVDITSIKERFPTQDEELWIAFEAGVEDVVTRKQPSTFILLYQQEAEQTLKDILAELSKYAACKIIQCDANPIEISATELNSPQVVREYGIIIEKYRPQLEEQGVMIIENLEKIRGVSAQAFHAFCDQYTPLVEKSLFIFTMRVDGLPESADRMKFIEESLKNKWTDVNVDALNALITRITSMVLEIRA